MAILNDMGMFSTVKHWDRTLVAFGPNIVVSWVDGHCHQVDKQMTHKHNSCANIASWNPVGGEQGNKHSKAYDSKV